MGYLLNELSNLPVDETVKKYIFLVKPAFHDDLSAEVMKNFHNIARDIGSNAIIATGLDEGKWLDQIGEIYLGLDWEKYQDLLPAIIITDSHPENVNEKSQRIFIPLSNVIEIYKTWSRFFVLITEYAKGRNDSILDKIQSKTDAFDTVNKIFNIKPGFLGISINVNELITSIIKQKKQKSAPPLIRN